MFDASSRCRKLCPSHSTPIPPIIQTSKNMKTATGLDVLIATDFAALRGRGVGLVCNQAAICRDYVHILDLLLPLHRAGTINLASIMGPQHGLFGHAKGQHDRMGGASWIRGSGSQSTPVRREPGTHGGHVGGR